MAVPSLSSASRFSLAGAAARASAALASGASSGLSDDQARPLSLVADNGEKVRSWLGRNPAISEGPAAARIRPPLSAVPGGVTRFQREAPAGRANSCQKLSWRATLPPMTTSAQVPPAVARDVARDGGGGAEAAAADTGGAGTVPQPASATAAV